MPEGNMEKIVQAIAELNPETDYTKTGVPTTEALEAASGVVNISAPERDEAWAIYESRQSSEPEAGGNEPEAGGNEPDASPSAEEATAGLMAAAKEAEKGRFMCEGKSVTSKIGIIGPGKRLEPEYFSGDGDAIIQGMVDRDMAYEVK